MVIYALNAMLFHRTRAHGFKTQPPDQPAGAISQAHLARPSKIADRAAYPFCLPFLRDDFELSFDRPITIIVGENGTGKSTLLEGIAVLAGYDEAGGGKGYHAGRSFRRAREDGRRSFRQALRASWLPKITNGWFFRAESFFSVARYLDEAARTIRLERPPPDFLSHSHGEGFLRFFEERCQRQGIFIFDEPESALSPARQIEFLKLMRRMEEIGDLPDHHGHAFADADGLSRRALLRLTKYGLEPVTVEGDRPLQGHARVLRGSEGICRRGDRGMKPRCRRSVEWVERRGWAVFVALSGS